MKVTFPAPSAPFPIGGVTAIYEFANGLCRRGHSVQVAHGPFMGNEIRDLEDLSWFSFEEGIDHRFVRRGDVDLDIDPADVIFGTGAAPELGLPAQLVQGFDMLGPAMEREALRTPSLKVCVASWLIGLAGPMGVDPAQFRVVPMGYDHQTFRVRTPFEERPPQVSVLYSEHPAKGWVTALRALTAARERVPRLEVVAFGTVDKDPGLPSWIRFVGHPTREQLAEEVYGLSQVFLQASKWEGFGLTALEAMACGAALVTTDNGGSWDYADHGRTALVARPLDHRGLADHLVTLLGDDERRIRMASAGSQAVERFDWDVGAERMEGVLQEYLADPASFLRPPVGPSRDVDAVGLAQELLESPRQLGLSS